MNPNAVAEVSGWTPLHDAAYSDSAEAVSLLIAAGANVNKKANSGATPLCFAAQENAPNATRILLRAGADPSVRCCEGNGDMDHYHSNRFSGYTPLHYCAHYNACKTAKVLIEMMNYNDRSSNILEIEDVNARLPIHIAVARGSSDVLRELLHGGARLDSDNDQIPRIMSSSPSNNSTEGNMDNVHTEALDNPDLLEPASNNSSNSSSGFDSAPSSPTPTRSAVITPVSSPVLRSMIPSEPVMSTKPWNCLSQRSIDDCKILLRDAESNWSPERHAIFHPRDRLAVIELLRVGKRYEQMGTGIFLELWPLVLSFCGRGWFEPEKRYQQLEGEVSEEDDAE